MNGIKKFPCVISLEGFGYAFICTFVFAGAFGFGVALVANISVLACCTYILIF
jgi:hypothetical protein